MNLMYSITTALANLMANKLRSALTMLGVIIGVSAVIIMVAIVQGASARVTSEFNRLGSSLIIIFYELDAKDEKKSTRRLEGLKMDDVHAIEERGDLVKSFSAELPIGQNASAKFLSKEMKVSPNGVMPAYERLRNVNVARGRFISDNDLDTWAKVCVIGDKVSKELFPDREPLGAGH